MTATGQDALTNAQEEGPNFFIFFLIISIFKNTYKLVRLSQFNLLHEHHNNFLTI